MWKHVSSAHFDSNSSARDKAQPSAFFSFNSEQNQRRYGQYIIPRDTQAHACADALWRTDRDLRAYARVKLRLWAFELWFSRRGPLDRAAVAVHVPDRTSGFARDDRD